MVLSEATDSDDSFSPSYDESTSDASEKPTARIDVSQLPRPLFLFGPLSGFTQKAQASFITAHITNAAQVLERTPTEEESRALAYWASSSFRIMSYGPTIGIAAAMYRAHQTRDTWCLPFYKRGQDFEPGVIKTLGGVQMLRGEAARRLQIFFRYAAYAVVGSSIAMILVPSYASTVSAVKELTDPRLSEMRKKVAERIDKRKSQGSLGSRTSDSTGRGPTSTDDSWGRPKHSFGTANTSEFDDASPSGGQSMEQHDYSYPQQISDPAQPASQRGSKQTVIPRHTPAQTEVRAKDFYSAFDDLEPSAPSPSTSGSIRGGSAWDRVRRQNTDASSMSTTPYGTSSDSANPYSSTPSPSSADSKPYPSPSSKRTQGAGESGGDGYSFSDTDEDRQLAREQAQTDFDKRLERERRGEDFGETSGGERKW